MRSLALCVVILVMAAAPGWCGNVCTGDISELTDFGKLAILRDSVCTQVSSFDRTGGNDDGFNGTYSYIRVENGKQVIFDADGPGCIYRLWSAMPNDQKLEFFFDGSATPGLSFDSWKNMYLGKVYPFLPPFSQHFIGGWCSYIPIPFAKHLKIVTHGKAEFLQITWQKFASAEGVTTFSTDYSDNYKASYEAAKKVWTDPGSAPWGSSTPAEWKSYDVDVSGAPGKAVDLLKLPQTGVVRAVYLTIENTDIRRYRKCVLQVWTDGETKPQVYCPYGDFFLDGFGWPAGQSILAGKKDGQYYSYWPMPFAKGIRIGMTNDTPVPLRIRGRIVVEPMETLPPDTGRFFAWWHRENPTKMHKGFEILTASGRGQWCGVNHLMQGPDGGVGYLEGDEMAWIDDRDNTYYNGTGTEDYFNGGWYFGALGSAPLYGCLAESDSGGTCDAYRFHLGDLVPFQKKAQIEIEHGSKNNHPIDLNGTTFWYAEPGTTHTFEPVAMADRLLAPRKDQATFEAEKTFLGGGPYVQITYSNDTFRFREAAVMCTASAPGGLILCKMDADATSEYEIRAQVVCGPDCGIVETLIDGKRVGGPVDCYSDVRELKVKTFAALTPEIHASGDHTLTFKVVGKSPRSKGYNMGVDSVYLSRPGIVEGENMKLTASSGGKAEIEPTAPYGPGWSGDSQVKMTGKAGDYFEFEMPVERTGRYNVGGYFAKGPNCGKIRLTLDNRVVEGELDLYGGVYHREPLMRFGGEYDLAAGSHKLRIDIIGKNPESKDYWVGLDAMSLERVTPGQ